MSAESTVAIEWLRPEQEMPRTDLTVLLCAPSASVDVFFGHCDSAFWRDERGMKLHSHVVAWAYLPTCPLARGAA